MPRILVAESDLPTISELENFLEKAKIHFDFAGSTTEAAELFAEEKFDLVIVGTLGAVNEKISAEDFLEEIVRSATPILFLLDEFRREIKKCGLPNCDYLRKPFSEKDLRAKIRGLVGN